MGICRIGTRRSALALAQSRVVQAHLQKEGVDCELVEVVSKGDKEQSKPLYEMDLAEGPGLFTKQLEQALFSDEIDIAVHSLKDLPTVQPDGLEVVAVSPRENPSDVLVVPKDKLSGDHPLPLGPKATLGTSSLRRQALVSFFRPDLQITPVRGNVPTRLEKLKSGQMDGVILAMAGLRRLGIEDESLVFVELPRADFVPAPGQGVVAIEARSSLASEWRSALQSFHCPKAELAARVERTILRELEGGCTLPFGVHVSVQTNNTLKIHSFLGVSRELSNGTRDWISFHPFAMSGEDPEEAVQTVVTEFRAVLDG